MAEPAPDALERKAYHQGFDNSVSIVMHNHMMRSWHTLKPWYEMGRQDAQRGQQRRYKRLR